MALTPNKINYSNGSSFETLGDILWPVGAIYQSMSSTSPADIVGGTWVQLTATFLRAENSSCVTGGHDGDHYHYQSVGRASNETTFYVFPSGNDNLLDARSTGITYPTLNGSIVVKGQYVSTVTTNSIQNSGLMRVAATSNMFAYDSNGKKLSGDLQRPGYTTCYVWYRTA